MIFIYNFFEILCRSIGFSVISLVFSFSLYKCWINNNLKHRRQNVPHQGECVVIIGASSGIGKELALLYASRGAQLLLVARRKHLLEDLQIQCHQLGGQTSICFCDISKSEEIKRLRVAATKLGRVDTLILNAGVLSSRTFIDLIDSEKDFLLSVEQVMKINYLSFVHITGALLPLLDLSKKCNVIILSSAAGVVGAPTRSLYAASKHALHGFYNSLRMEWQGTNRHICLICPGSVSTDLRLSAVDGNGKQVPGSLKGNLNPTYVASRVITASDNSESLVFLPFFYRFTALLDYFLPELITHLARKKYGIV